MNKTKQKAFERMKLNKASRAELEILLEWAEQELREWKIFIGLCKRKLNKIK